MFKTLEYLLIFFVLGALSVLLIANTADKISSEDARIVESAVQDLSDSVRSLGRITPYEYDRFLSVITSMGGRASVELEHRKKRYEPIYSNPNNFSTFSGDFNSLYDDYYTQDLLNVLYPDDYTVALDDPVRFYKMSQGDLFFVRVKLSPSYAERLKSGLLRSSPSESIVTGGGLVLDES